MEWVTLAEAAELEGLKYDTVKKRCQRRVYDCKSEPNPTGGKAITLIKVGCLSKKAQRRYYSKQKLPKAIAPKRSGDKITLEELTATQRDTAAFWEQVIKEWRCTRLSEKSAGRCLADADAEFCNAKGIKLSTLYRKAKEYDEGGPAALADMRGCHNRGRTSIDPRVWQVFESLWLDENRPSVALCYQLTAAWVEREGLDVKLQSQNTFARQAAKIPEAVRLYFRYGDKACEDKAMPYITRIYDDLESNDIWVGDNHTLDFMVRDSNGKLHRFYITTYLDCRSRKIMSCYVTQSPDSNSVLYAMRRGFERYGIPRELYLDNGREFLVHDIGGRGRRKTAKTAEHSPPTILDRLGIKMTNARVRNGRAKIVERVFKEVKENFSKLFLSYTGGNVLEKPERLRDILKKGGGVDAAKLNEYVQLWVDGYYNKKAHGGAGMKNKCPDEVWAENLITKRTAGADELNLMLMRSTRVQKVNRLGVSISIGGERLNYWDEAFINSYLGKKVYVRYDPLNLAEVRVYDEEDRFIRCVGCEVRTILSYGAGAEEVKAAINKIHSVKKTAKAYRQSRGLDGLPNATALELMMYKAEQGARVEYSDAAKVLELVRADDALLPKAVGASDVDTARMARNAKKWRFGKED